MQQKEKSEDEDDFSDVEFTNNLLKIPGSPDVRANYVNELTYDSSDSGFSILYDDGRIESLREVDANT